MLVELLHELQEKVFQYTDVDSLSNLSLCSRSYSEMCKPFLWKNIKVPLPHLLDSLISEHHKEEVEHLQHARSLRLIGVDMTQQNLNIALTNIRKLLASSSNLSVLHTWFLPKNVFSGFPQIRLQEVCLTRYAATDVALETLSSGHPQLRSLALENGRIFTGKAALSINKLKKLEKLSLLYCNIYLRDITGDVPLLELSVSQCVVEEEDIFSCCSSFRNMKRLTLYSCNNSKAYDDTVSVFTDIGILSCLRELNVSQMPLGDAAMNSLRACKQLQSLEARSTQITDTGLTFISQMICLHKIDVSHCQWITSEGVSHLVRLPHLAVLYMNGCGVDDDCMKTISTIGTLKDVSLCGCRMLTDTCVPHLCTIPRLERLDICGCYGITENARESLLAQVKHLLT